MTDMASNYRTVLQLLHDRETQNLKTKPVLLQKNTIEMQI